MAEIGTSGPTWGRGCRRRVADQRPDFERWVDFDPRHTDPGPRRPCGLLPGRAPEVVEDGVA